MPYCTCCIRGFWHKVLYDLGHLSSREPFRRLVNQGYIQAYAYTDARGSYVPAADVVERAGKFFLPGPDGEIEVFQEFRKIGKSLKNSISPDEICDDYGADTCGSTRCRWGHWTPPGRGRRKTSWGAHRFLQRVWRLIVDEKTDRTRVSEEAGSTTPRWRALHGTIAGVADD